MLLPRSRYSAPYVPVALSRGRIDLRSEQCKSIPIRTGQEQPSQRVERTGRLGSARIPCQVDIGFGDVVVPGPEDVQFPTLLDGMAAPSVRAYPRTSSVAEKFEAIVQLALQNSRMKDFHDIFGISGDVQLRRLRAERGDPGVFSPP